MSTYTLGTYKKYEKTAKTIATIFGVAFLILFFLNLLTYQDPPPGQSGILVSFGQPNIGQGEEVSAPPPAAAEEEEVEEAQPEPDVSEPEPVESEPEVTPPSKPEPSKPEPVTEKDVVEDAKAKALAIKKKKEQEKKREEERAERAAELEAQKKADAEAKKKRDAAEAKRKAEAKKAAEAAAKKAEADKLKGEIGGLFGQDGDGKGNTGTSGNQGDPNGDPNSDILNGISTGGGKVGGSIGSRNGKGPKITDSSQAVGKVVIRVCVDDSGKVVSAKFTQGGSTTTNSQLKSIAIANAKKWRFDGASLDRNDCGTITYDFKVK